MTPVTVAGEVLHLLPEKAAYWPAAGTLFVADLHLGKPDTFAAAGIAVPTATAAADLFTLGTLVERHGARRLVVLGDLFHARAGLSAELFETVAAWRTGLPGLDVLVIRGNHDRHAGDPPPEWGFRVEAEPLADGPFALRHHPDPTPGLYTLAGHVHPSFTLHGRGRQRLRLPCFWLGRDVGILPAFGGFTGTAGVRKAAGDRVWVVAGGEVLPAG